MVDSVGGKPLSVRDGSVGRVERVGQARAAETQARAEPSAPAGGFASASIGQVARELAASPPVESDRVARIRRAIAEGKFPLSPATVADRLIAFRLNWNGNEQA